MSGKNIIEAAKERRDEEMITRLPSVSNADIIACDARYHRKKCYYRRYVNTKCTAKAMSAVVILEMILRSCCS